MATQPKEITVRIKAEDLTESLIRQIKETVLANLSFEVRQHVPDFVISALTTYLNGHVCEDGLGQDVCNECTWCKVNYWVHGDELEPNEPFYVFTFGYDHTDKDGNTLGRAYVRVKGSYTESRTRMLATFSNKWSMQYGSVDEAEGNGKYVLTDRTDDLVPEEFRP